MTDRILRAHLDRGSAENEDASSSYVVRRVLDEAERFLGWLYRRQRIEPSAQPVKLNLGSGLYVAPGWINLDGSAKTWFARLPQFALRWAYPLATVKDRHSREEFVSLLRDHRFVYHNLKYGIPLPDSSVDFVFSSHMLHHLYREEALKLLREALRVLKPGGTMRIAVPDLEWIMALYRDGKREQALEYFFYSKAPRSNLSRRCCQYDFTLLKDLMDEAGVRNVRRCKSREGKVPDLDRLDRLVTEACSSNESADYPTLDYVRPPREATTYAPITGWITGARGSIRSRARCRLRSSVTSFLNPIADPLATVRSPDCSETPSDSCRASR